MSRLPFAVFLCTFLVALTGATAWAKDTRPQYEPININALTEFLVRSKLIKLDTKQKAMNYLAINECEIYKTVKNSQFKQQEIQTALQKKIEQPIPGDGFLYVKVPTLFYVSDYNFDTQSMALAPESQIRRANVLDLLNETSPICEDVPLNAFALPTLYNIRLNIPISLFRIPLKKEIAETIYNKMDRTTSGKIWNVVYGTFYIQIEPIAPAFDITYNTARATVRGEVNMIDIFLDQDRKVLLRQFNFAENF